MESGKLMNTERYTYEEIAAALRKSYGNATQAGRLIGCTDRTIRSYISRYPKLKEVRRQGWIARYNTPAGG